MAATKKTTKKTTPKKKVEAAVSTYETAEEVVVVYYSDVNGRPLNVGDDVDILHHGFRRRGKVAEKDGRKYITGHEAFTMVDTFNGTDETGRIYFKIN